MDDMPSDTLLDFAKRYLIALMLESGMSQETVEGYVARIAHTHPLRDYFVRQFISMLPDNERPEAAVRLLEYPTAPIVGMSVQTSRRKLVLPVSAHLNNKDVDKIARRIFQSDGDRKPESGRSRDN